MIIYGASGHGRVIASCLKTLETEVTGFFDDGFSCEEFMGTTFLGGYNPNVKTEKSLVLGIGDNYIRSILARNVDHEFGTVVHPSAIIDESVTYREGSVIFHGAIVQVGSTIGRHCIVNTGATIDHDCKIGDYVHISPQATLCGNVTVGKRSQVGANAVVLPNVNIGKDVVVGAGSVVTSDIPDKTIAVGNPAKMLRYNER